MNDLQNLIEHYNHITAQYHERHHQINQLLHHYNGATENMPPEQIQRYRQLAQQRDELYNEMRQIEQILLADSTDDITD